MIHNHIIHNSSHKAQKSFRTNNGDKKPWFALLALSLLFYGTMLLLTLFAKNIHYARLPQVTAERLGKQRFSYAITIEGYTTERTSSLPALPKELVDTNQVFILETKETDDFTYYYARKASVTIDKSKENADYYAIADGLDSRSMVILTGYEKLNDGEEVFLVKEKKEKQKELSTENLFQ